MAVIVWFARVALLWVVICSVLLWVLAAACGRAALVQEGRSRMPELRAVPPRRPYIIMNPRSGGVKVGSFHFARRLRPWVPTWCSSTRSIPRTSSRRQDPYGPGAVAGPARASHGRSGGLTSVRAREVVVDSDGPVIRIGLDGESLTMPTPVRCHVEPGALRVLLPRHRPGAGAGAGAGVPMNWPEVRRPAFTTGRAAGSGR